jgi:hypothetical protein
MGDGQAEDGREEDDQGEDIADDSPEVEGDKGLECEIDGAAGLHEAEFSGESTASANSSVEGVRGVEIRNGQAFQNVRERQAYLAANIQRNVLKAIRDALFNDPYIHDTAEAYGFPENARTTMVEKNGLRCLCFYVRAAFFEDWLKRHSDSIGAKFTFRDSPRPYSTNIKESSTQAKKDRAGQIVSRYSCHRKSMKHMDKNHVKGGKTNKARIRLPSIKCKCPSYINATFRPRSTSDGMPGDTYKIEYFFEHNHMLGSAENIGSMRKSEAIKLRIKAMIMRGMSIQAIMEQLTMDHAKFARFLEGKETMPLSRDNFITYDDVYNILHAITAKEVRKSDDDIISARLWMEELDRNNYFTFYDKVNGLYHGFSSPWQLDQLRQWGDVFCFDATHHARGYVICSCNLRTMTYI